jgi:tetratricopeptide (TPR) repeat protein
MTTPEVQAVMQGIAGGLGVQCAYCHIPGTPPPVPEGAAPGRGRGGPVPLNFAADDKQEKKTARVMLRMVKELNGTVPTAVGKPATDVVQIQCVTCHRGVAIPAQLSSVLSQVMLSKGEGAAIARYRELRAQYYGTQAYDFTEPMLTRLAQQSLATNKPDDALAWLKLNLEFYPKSAASMVVLSQVHARKNDRRSAMTDLEQALALDPNNMQTKRQLDQLKSQVAASQ